MQFGTLNDTHLELLFHLYHKWITVQFCRDFCPVFSIRFHCELPTIWKKNDENQKTEKWWKNCRIPYCSSWRTSLTTHWFSLLLYLYSKMWNSYFFHFPLFWYRSVKQCLFVLSIPYFFHLHFGLNEFLFFKGLICDANRMIQILFVESWILSIWSKVCWSLK